MVVDSITRSLIIKEVKRRGWSMQGVGTDDYFLKIIHPDGRWEMVRGSMPMRTSALGNIICQHKHLTMDFVQSYGYRVPVFQIADNESAALSFLEQYGKIVLKPADGQRTEGVTVGITEASAARQAFAYALQNSRHKRVIAQQHLDGRLYRLVVINGKLVAAAWRTAATVAGDGNQTVEQLIAQTNRDPRRGKGIDTPLKTIDPTAAAEFLGQERLQTVPAPGERVVVSAIDSISAGGEAINVTDQVHDDWRYFTETIAAQAGLFISGYDVICEDISQPLQNDFVPLLEINSAPGMKLHEYPTGGGEPIHLAPILLDELFPQADAIAKQA